MSYRNLEIWQLARKLTNELHILTIQDIPKFEMYETGSQLRRSIKSVKANIVEGYGRRKYPNDYIRFLIYAQASLDESMDHLETLFETGSFTDKEKYNELHEQIDKLGRKLNLFIQAVQKNIH